MEAVGLALLLGPWGWQRSGSLESRCGGGSDTGEGSEQGVFVGPAPGCCFHPSRLNRRGMDLAPPEPGGNWRPSEPHRGASFKFLNKPGLLLLQVC